MSIKEIEKNLKHTLKNKIKLTEAFIITLLITGNLSIANTTNPLTTPSNVRTGVALTNSATAIGDGSISTGENTTAIGINSIATGNGFTREDYNRKKQELSEHINNKRAKQNELDDLNNQKNANNTLIENYGNQISLLSDRLRAVETLTRQKENYISSREQAEQDKSRLEEELNNKKNQYSSILSQDRTKVEYLDLTKILERLDWSKLQSGNSSEKRVELANDLKTEIVNKFSNFADRFDDVKYQNIITGYLNRQAAYVGLVNDFIEYKNSNTLAKYLNKEYYALMNNYGVTFNLEYDNTYDDIYNSLTNDNEKYFMEWFFITGDIYRKGNKKILDSRNKNTNRLILHNISSKKLSDENKFNGINRIQLNGKERYYIKLKNGNDFSLNQEIPKYGLYGIPIYEIYSMSTNYFDGDRTNREFSYDIDNVKNAIRKNKAHLLLLDKTSVNTFYNDFNKIVNDQNTEIVSLFNNNEVKKYLTINSNIHLIYDNIDWNHDKSVIDLNDYKIKFEKAMNYSDKTKEWLLKYKEIVNLAENSGSPDEIYAKTSELIRIREELNELAKDKDSQFENIEVIKNEENIKYYLEYGLEEYRAFMTPFVEKANNAFKLYDQNDEIVVAYKNEVDRVIAELNNLDTEIKNKENEIRNTNENISNLGLTDSDNQLNEKKKEIENKLLEARNKEKELDVNIREKEAEINELDNTIRNTNLGNIGLNSTANGKDAFASGINSIAFGTNATVTADRSIALGIDNTVTSLSSVAIGDTNSISGNKVIAIGVGHTVVGNGSATVGDPNSIYGDNNHIYGNNNNVGTRKNPKNNNYILGSGIDATNVENSITLGNNSKAISDSVSIGSDNNTRNIKYVKEGEISISSKDAINGSQLFDLANGTLAEINVDGWKNKLGITNLSSGNAKVTKASLLGDDIINITGTGKILDSDITISINDASIGKEKLNKALADEIDRKVSKEVMAITLISKADKNANNLDDNDVAKWREKLGINPDGNVVSNPDAVSKKYVDDMFGKVKEGVDLSLSGVSSAIAMANLIQASSFSEYKHQLSAAYGYYGSYSALAIGFSGITENRKVTYRISGSVNNAGNLGLGAGIGIMLGEKLRENNKNDMPKNLNNKLEALENENAKIKERITELENIVNKLLNK